ncbi:hypothetical protein H5410_064171, partial [Solanum commersonii]
MALGVCLQLFCLLPSLFSNKFTAEVEPNDKVVLNNCKYHNTIKSSVKEKNVAKKLYKAFHTRFSQGREYLERKGIIIG